MNLLFIAYYFPPDSSSGSFRPMYFANHLAEAGVGVHVLTADQDDYLAEQTLDLRLLEMLHPDVLVTRCSVKRAREALVRLRNRVTPGSSAATDRGSAAGPPAAHPGVGPWQMLKDLVSDLLITPDVHAGWFPDCVKKGISVIRRRRPDLIIATGGPWTGLLAGVLLKRWTGVPLIVDFRDPWTSNPNASRRSRVARYLNKYLERVVVGAADGVIANTHPLREDFRARYPFLQERQVTTITNGFEEYLPVPDAAADRPLTIVHTGELYLSRNPGNLLAALKLLIERRVVSANEMRLVLVGGLEMKGEGVSSLLADETLQRVVTVQPRVPYDEAQKIASGADLLLLVQPDLPLQVPRKVYEYMALRKPIICISEPDSATSRLVIDNQVGVVTGNTVAEIYSCLEREVSAWRDGRQGSFRDGRCDRFKNNELSRQLYQFINSLLSPNLEPLS